MVALADRAGGRDRRTPPVYPGVPLLRFHKPHPSAEAQFASLRDLRRAPIALIRCQSPRANGALRRCAACGLLTPYPAIAQFIEWFVLSILIALTCHGWHTNTSALRPAR